jgi:hypothetical protein
VLAILGAIGARAGAGPQARPPELQPIPSTLAAPALAQFWVAGGSDTTFLQAGGDPAPEVSVIGALPSGLRLVHTGGATWAITGRPGASSLGTRSVLIAAANGVAPVEERVLVVDVALVCLGELCGSATPAGVPGAAEGGPTYVIPVRHRRNHRPEIVP